MRPGTADVAEAELPPGGLLAGALASYRWAAGCSKNQPKRGRVAIHGNVEGAWMGRGAGERGRVRVWGRGVLAPLRVEREVGSLGWGPRVGCLARCLPRRRTQIAMEHGKGGAQVHGRLEGLLTAPLPIPRPWVRCHSSSSGEESESEEDEAEGEGDEDKARKRHHHHHHHAFASAAPIPAPPTGPTPGAHP